MTDGEIVRLEIGASQRLSVALAAMHGLACAMPWVTALPPIYALPATLVIAASLRHTLRGEARRVAPDSIVEIHLHPDCRCEFVTRAGISGEAALLGTSFVAPYLTILNLQPLEGRWARHVVILPDAVNREIFRKLRVVLKWRCGKPSEEA